MRLKSTKGCRLAIGSYPYFDYDGTNGGGTVSFTETKDKDTEYVKFCTKTFLIPSLTWKTTKFLSLPIPPGIKIEMIMDKLEGTINQKSGEILLEFEARFVLSIFSIYKFPNLLVNSLLNTGIAKTKLHKAVGLTLQEDGRTRLVGISTIPKTNNRFLDSFLSLPNQALAVLNCQIERDISTDND